MACYLSFNLYYSIYVKVIMKLINYSGNTNKTGIYCIRNLVNSKIYIGSTKTSFLNRKNNHLLLLRKNKHYNEHLQNAWNNYYEENFSFEVLYICLASECEKYEGDFIKLYNSNRRNFGYNIASVSSYRYKYNMSKLHNDEKSNRKINKCININGLESNERGLSKPFKVYDLNGVFIEEYNSAKEYCVKNNVKARGTLSGILSRRELIYRNFIILFSNDMLLIEDILYVKKKKTRKSVDLFDLNGNHIRKFLSVNDCSKFLNVKPSEIRMCCSGKRSRIREYITKY